MTSNDKEGWVKVGMIKFSKPNDKLVNDYQNLKYKQVVADLKKIEQTTDTAPINFKKEKNFLMTRCASESPDEFQKEDDDGSYFPKQIPLPAAHFIQFAEPHVLISDWSEEVKQWYHFRELIQELERQAFVSYYHGTYFACFMCAVGCLEYILKYEYVRKTHDESILQNYTFGTMISNKLGDVNLSKHKNELERINELRNGFFHLNTTKMKSAVVELRTKETQGATINVMDIETDGSETLQMDKKYHEDTFAIPDNEEMSKISQHAYCLLNKITDELYGPNQQVAFIKECVKDYESRYMKK